MQDGYHFATAPWLIGDTAATDDDRARMGQVVRIEAEPEWREPAAIAPLMVEAAEMAGDAEVEPLPVMLRTADRVPEVAEQTFSSDPVGVLDQVMNQLLAHQDTALARIEQAQQDGLARLEQRLDAGLGAGLAQNAYTQRIDLTLAAMAQEQAAQAEALHGFAAGFEAMTARLGAAPLANDSLLRDVADIRAGLTELRVQARLIEIQLFALGRGADGPYPRVTAPEGLQLAS
jgi:hypothetical protein